MAKKRRKQRKNRWRKNYRKGHAKEMARTLERMGGIEGIMKETGYPRVVVEGIIANFKSKDLIAEDS